MNTVVVLLFLRRLLTSFLLWSVVQVRGSSGQAREALRRHFAELQAAASRLLTERLNSLLAEVDAIEADSVKPLDDCQSLIEHGVGQADELLREGGSQKYYTYICCWTPSARYLFLFPGMKGMFSTGWTQLFSVVT